ncbi:MAG: TRAP transporter large permease subunit [Pararhodobacter sp.]|nr:TRAP transporter large permease subunit [Pararhodobacter sp.]
MPSDVELRGVRSGPAGNTASDAQIDAKTRVARAILRTLDTVIGAVAVAALVALVCIVFVNVVGRYGFGRSLMWSLEAARWLFIAIIMLGVPLAHRLRMHLKLSVLVDMLPAPGRLAAELLANVIVAWTTILLLFGGLTLIQTMGGVNVSLGLPQWARVIPVPIACGLALVYMALQGLDEGRNPFMGIVSIALAALFYMFGQDVLSGLLQGVNPAGLMALAFAAAMLIGTPVAFAMLFSAFLANLAGGMLPDAAVVQNLVNGASKFLMLAIPFFILAGALMNAGGLTTKLIDFAYALVGHMRGGLAQVNVVSSGLYAGISGSSYSDAALGAKLLVPQMVRHGYSKPFACAVTAASATLPNVIPPSIALLLVAAAGNISVGALWIAGIVPGLLMAGFLMALIWGISVRRGYGAGAARVGWALRGRAFLTAAPVLSLALLIIVGIRFGVVTPTEAGVLAVVYAFFLGTVVYRAWGVKSLYESVRTAAVEAALVGFLIGAASPFAFVLIAEQVPQTFARVLPEVAGNLLLTLILINIILLIFGLVLDIGAAILILTPLLLPSMVALGIDPVHFGIIVVVNLMLGGLTPPVGMLAFITSNVTGTPVHLVFRNILPFLGALLVALGLITALPGISLGLGRLIDAL